MKNVDGNYNFQNAFLKMMKAKEHHRAIEEIVCELKEELMPVKEELFLIHAMRLMLELGSKKDSPLYTHLQSPMRQVLYLIDVYYSIDMREESAGMDDERWERIAILLDEIEMTYFVNIGFPNDGDLYHDERDAKIEVSLPTFMSYFSNAVLSYEEQTLDRIIRYLKPYDEYVKSRCGFRVDEALKFILHVRALNNRKLNNIHQPLADNFHFYSAHPEEWRKLTRKFEERGIDDPRDWWYQPELSGILDCLTTNPGEITVHEAKDLTNVDITAESLCHILKFFSYDKDSQKGKLVYYAGKHHSESNPLIPMGGKYACSGSKFLFEALYFRLDDMLMKDEPTKKYKQNKDFAFEKKVAEVFRRFFPEKAKIFVNYSLDGIAENDLLVITGTTCIIVEIKDCKFREPFRDPIKAYDRIKRDYQNAVQLGYDQCRRVEKALLAGKDVDILDADDKKKVLYHLKGENISDIWSIVVTDFKYGAIQTNLGNLLKKDEEALYPWSVCIDDLEAFFLLMKKTLKGIAPSRFVEFLDYRERLQEHIVCDDELEICGWFLNDREQFKEYADKDTMINMGSDMGAIFDAYYRIGLGFKNELDMEYKKHYKLPNYPRSFELTEFNSAIFEGGSSIM